MLEIKDNFLEEKDFVDLHYITLLWGKFPWYLNHGVSYKDDGMVQFTHLLYKDNKFQSSFTLGGLDIFKEKLNIKKIVRAKFNLLYRTEKIVEHLMHVDLEDAPKETKTAILYLNNNNGYTRFENGEKVTSVANRLVLFDADVSHGGTTNNCDQPYRAVFNLNYIPNFNKIRTPKS
tara:strand:+ start:53 stop:580 length:528 start_codon:yes stop_codon:yes gene_type:complete